MVSPLPNTQRTSLHLSHTNSPTDPMTTPTSHQSAVLKAAILSRLLLLSVIILWRSLLNPYDTSAILNPNCLTHASSTQLLHEKPPLFPRLGSAVESSIVWDSVYFVRIAQCGYEYEQTYAFFPLLPICIFVLSNSVLWPLVPIIGYRAVLGLSGYLISNVAFVVAAVYLYKLSVLILKDSKAALRASVLFCFNPASIFYSSIYAESLYSLFSIGGVFHLLSGADNIAILLLALSGSARSNGMLNAGYICFQTMHRAYEALFRKKRVLVGIRVLVSGAMRSLIVFIPLIAFQAFGYYNICLGHLSDNSRPWCSKRVPMLYNYIQSHYWGVGFLRYFQLKQLPNFLLASPILSLAFCSISTYVISRPTLLFSLGFQASDEEKTAEPLFFPAVGLKSHNISLLEDTSQNSVINRGNLRRRKHLLKEADPSVHAIGEELPVLAAYVSASVLPFILHLGFMVATAFFVMHVQVATRFLSASPPLYWFASYIMISPSSGRRWGYLIWAYSAAYILLGSLLFSNFYPFT